MLNKQTTPPEQGEPLVYQIKIKGHLDMQWEDWFEGLTITPLSNNETLIAGSIADQAALHGILKKIRDLGLPLISVQPLGSNHPGQPDRLHEED